jgi:hypothetical protein
MLNMDDKTYSLQLYTKMYNTLMEMAWTFEDWWLNDDIKQDIIRITDAIDTCVLESDESSEDEKKYFTEHTDMIQDRIYFNI